MASLMTLPACCGVPAMLFFLPMVFFCLFLEQGLATSWNSLWTPGWPQTHRDPSASQVLVPKACSAAPNINIVLTLLYLHAFIGVELKFPLSQDPGCDPNKVIQPLLHGDNFVHHMIYMK